MHAEGRLPSHDCAFDRLQWPSGQAPGQLASARKGIGNAATGIQGQLATKPPGAAWGLLSGMEPGGLSGPPFVSP